MGATRPSKTKIGVDVPNEYLLKKKRIAELALIAFELFRKICLPRGTDC